tara:strand:+ start:240 stop:482 length:243 start_codon:yes stop_codon:yes gene_type:complete
MNNDKIHFKKIIDMLVEEMGSLNPRAFHGYGAVQPYYVKSTREMLGDVEHPTSKKNKLDVPVKISRAFLDTDDDEDDNIS